MLPKYDKNSQALKCGSSTNEVRGSESRKLFGVGELSTDQNVNNFGSVDGKYTPRGPE